jgi:arylsulfatase A-like enzyme/tetratricopeptide (TPR) repeat protein
VAGSIASLRHLRPKVARAERGLSVLLVTIDTLRADALGCYGRHGSETPRMDRLAASGVRFDFAHAHNVVTLPSHASILSGRYPFDHGVRENSGFRFPAGVETLATLLRRQGYRTGAFVSAFPLDSRFGLDRGFDVYDDRLGDAAAGSDFRMQERAGTKTLAAARAWLQATPGPTFCWVHLYEPHAPYEPPSDWQGRVASAYDGEVAAADAALAPLIDPLLARGRESDTLVVLTSDHGEGLGDHGEATHGVFAYEATLRVPLVFHNPRLFTPRVVTASVRHVDLAPTVLEAVGLPLPEGLAGRSLLGVAQGLEAAEAPPSYFETLTPALTRGWAPIYGVLRDRQKYLDSPLPELYDLVADPREAVNLVALRPAPLEQMRGLLARLRALDKGMVPSAMPSEVRERLATLGYVGGGGSVAAHYGEADDPKRHVAFENDLERVIRRYVEGDVAGALSLCERLVEENPRVPLALRHLSFLRRRAGDLAGAVAAGRQALAANPGSVETAVELGRLLDEIGRPREAVAALAPYAKAEDADLDVLVTYGVALSRAGQRVASIAALQKARQADPSSALAAFGLGSAHLLFGDHARAREALVAALDLEPDLAQAYVSLGLLAAVDGSPDEAVRLWTRALDLAPGDPDTLFNLGTLLWRKGRREEARPHLEQFLAVAPPLRYAEDLARVRAWLGTLGVHPAPTARD